MPLGDRTGCPSSYLLSQDGKEAESRGRSIATRGPNKSSGPGLGEAKLGAQAETQGGVKAPGVDRVRAAPAAVRAALSTQPTGCLSACKVFRGGMIRPSCRNTVRGGSEGHTVVAQWPGAEG